MFFVLAWAVFQLCTARVHILGPDGKIYTCELFDICHGDSGTYHIYMPDAVRQELYVIPDSINDNALTAETYVLPLFGRLRTVVNADGYATVKRAP